MPRKKRPIERTESTPRDCSLFVVACEDKYAVKQYLAKFNVRRVQFKVLPTEDTHSAPDAVFARLDQFREDYDLAGDDQLWLCIDTDHWVEKNFIAKLTKVLQECKQKGIQIALSNPCFELWLTLNFSKPDPANCGTCAEVVAYLKQVASGYNKANIRRLKINAEMVLAAIERARSLDDQQLIPKTIGTQVYKLIEELQIKEAISIDNE